MSAAPILRHRESVFLMAEVTGGHLPPQRCRVRNVSGQGICLEKPTDLRRGERVAISVGAIDRALAEVVWASDSFAGLRFLYPVDAAAARKRPRQSVDPETLWTS